jgi:hypothetical protein
MIGGALLLNIGAGELVGVETFLHGAVLLSGILGAIGTGYLLYSGSIIVHYTSFFKVITAGLFIFSVTAPIIVQFAPNSIHLAHALSAVFISIGLWILIREKVQNDDSYDRLSTDFTKDSDS